jgi:ATP-dependent helicase HrpA
VTDSLLVAEAQNKPWFDAYHTVIIGEAHEGNMNIGLLLCLTRCAVKERPEDFRVVIMSAAIAVERLVAYFTGYGKAASLQILGETYQVDLYYLSDAPQAPENALGNAAGALPAELQVCDVVEESCRIVAQITRDKMPAGDILVFMAGTAEVSKVCHRLADRVPEVLPVVLYSAISAPAQHIILQGGGGRRVCIVATNVVETSITLPNVGYVIDAMLERVSRWMPGLGGAFDIQS